MAERSNPLRLRFAEGELTASMQAPDVGEARETVPLEFAGDPLEIGFNPGFLREGIESVDSDEILLKLISPLRPAVLMGAEDDYTYLIMPIRLPGSGSPAWFSHLVGRPRGWELIAVVASSRGSLPVGGPWDPRTISYPSGVCARFWRTETSESKTHAAPASRSSPSLKPPMRTAPSPRRRAWRPRSPRWSRRP